MRQRRRVVCFAYVQMGSRMREHSKADIAASKGVTTRTVDNWVARNLLPRPRKWGTPKQARVR
jgi:hypothetical protein